MTPVSLTENRQETAANEGARERRGQGLTAARPKTRPIYATEAALVAAARAGVSGCLEERVREGILAGLKRRRLPGLPRLVDGAYVPLAAAGGGAAVAVLAKVPRRLRSIGRAWLVRDVIPSHRLAKPLYAWPRCSPDPGGR